MQISVPILPLSPNNPPESPHPPKIYTVASPQTSRFGPTHAVGNKFGRVVTVGYTHDRLSADIHRYCPLRSSFPKAGGLQFAGFAR